MEVGFRTSAAHCQLRVSKQVSQDELTEIGNGINVQRRPGFSVSWTNGITAWKSFLCLPDGIGMGTFSLETQLFA